MTTSAPRRAQTLPSSSPMTPAQSHPTAQALLQNTRRRWNPPRDRRLLARAESPQALTLLPAQYCQRYDALLARRICHLNLPPRQQHCRPVMTVTPLAFSRPDTPPVSWETILSLRAIMPPHRGKHPPHQYRGQRGVPQPLRTVASCPAMLLKGYNRRSGRYHQ